MRRSTATGWPLDVMIKSSLPADFNHWLAGFFFNSLTEIVLTVAIYKDVAATARRQAKSSASGAWSSRCPPPAFTPIQAAASFAFLRHARSANLRASLAPRSRQSELMSQSSFGQ